MFPIRDHNPSGRTPYVTYALLAANIVIFLAYWSVYPDDRALFRFFLEWGMVPGAITSGVNQHTIFTSMFLHGGWMHLAGNMLFLWIYGDNIEDKMGHVPYLLFYLACGIGAALIHVAAGPYSTVPTVGASGAIAGVMGGYLLLFPKARVDIFVFFIVFFRIFPIPAWIVLSLWLALQFFGGFAHPSPDGGGVAYWAHIGGFAVGILLTLPLFLRLGGTAFWSATHGAPPNPEAQYKYARSAIPRVTRK
ncbi:MAG: rhomboid family intramembrane serine protease [Pseudomonadota bacterium]